MMRLLTLLLLLYPGAVLVEVANGFSAVTHYYGQPRPLAIKSRARFVTFPRPPITHRFATSDDTSSPDDSNEGDTPPDSDEAESPTSSADDDEKDSPSSEAGDKDLTDDSTLDTDDDDKPTFRERLKKLWWKNDDSDLTTRQRLAKMGLAAVLSYGWVSNVSYAICISIAWYGFSSKVSNHM
jgi:hypothetical protein